MGAIQWMCSVPKVHEKQPVKMINANSYIVYHEEKSCFFWNWTSPEKCDLEKMISDPSVSFGTCSASLFYTHEINKYYWYLLCFISFVFLKAVCWRIWSLKSFIFKDLSLESTNISKQPLSFSLTWVLLHIILRVKTSSYILMVPTCFCPSFRLRKTMPGIWYFKFQNIYLHV